MSTTEISGHAVAANIVAERAAAGDTPSDGSAPYYQCPVACPVHIAHGQWMDANPAIRDELLAQTDAAAQEIDDLRCDGAA